MRRALSCLFVVACSSPPATNLQTFSERLGALVHIPDTFVLDLAGNRRLVGESDPVAADADPTFAIRLRLEVDGAAVRWPLAGRAISHARLLSDDHVAAITPDGELLTVALGTQAVTSLDQGATGPIGASVDGRHLVYTKGEAPEFEVVALDRTTGTVRAVTRDMAPCWSPAISEDGHRVVFASSHSGVPSLWTQRDDDPPQQLTNVGLLTEVGVEPELAPYPDGPSAMLLAANRLAFATPASVVVMDLDGRVVDTVVGARAPHWVRPGAVLGVLLDGRVLSRPVPGARR